ncbi:hypothetical protein [Aliiglaciecola sp. NS0011-25]|uniref:hypothetical protein n=1 Tax=Aliiglaciecola sp. NS0011-25 TaxID=3127654 RepID=UPI00310B3869
MNKHSIIYLALDTHNEFNEVAYCEEQEGSYLFAKVVFHFLKSVSKSLSANLNLNTQVQHYMLSMKQERVAIGFIV